jgi:hypothetical protein
MKSAHTLAVLVAVLSTACGPSRTKKDDEPGPEARQYAERACQAIRDCDCVSRFEASEDCVAAYTARFNAALEEGLELDTECFESALSGMSDCQGRDLEGEPPACVVLRGDRKGGEECSRHYDLPGLEVNPCGAGLLCGSPSCIAEGSMAEPYPPRSAGETCSLTTPIACGVGAVYCDYDETCAPTADLGGMCNHPQGCYSDADPVYCRGVHGPGDVGQCETKLAIDAACDPLDYFPCSGARCDPATSRCTSDEAEPICVNAELAPAWPNRDETE